MSESSRRHTIKKIILGYILGLVTLAGIAFASGQPEPSVGLYWYANTDPTTGAGVSAPQYQLLIRTDTQAIYWKSGPTNTAWTKIAGTGAGGSVTSITCGTNGGLLCSPNPISTTGTISVAQLLTIPSEQINTETATELDNYDPWHAGAHTTRVEVDPTQPSLLITGIVAGTDGDLLWLWNGGNGGTNPNWITLVSQSASSSALNRFWVADGKIVNIPNNDGVLLIYDGSFGWTCFQCATSILRGQELSVDPVAIPTALASSSTTNNYNPWSTLISPTSYVRQDVTGSGTATISGITAAGAPNSEGRLLFWNNISAAGSQAFLNASGLSTAPNQLLTPGGVTITIGPGGSAIFIYDTTEDAWRLVSASVANSITGSGTANSIPVFTTASVIGNSSITDNGTTVATAEPVHAGSFEITTGPTWTDGASAPTGACTTGSMYSVTSNIAPGFYVCSASAWVAVSGGTVTGSLTSGDIPVANGTTSLANSSVSDNGTTVATAEPVHAGSFGIGSGPTWTSGTSAPTGSCTTGSTYSVTTSSANPALYACANSGWVNVTTGAVQKNVTWWGPGSDGTITFDGTSTVLGLVPAASTYTLTRDIAPANMTVNAGVTIATANYAITIQNTLTNNGTISNNGQAGSHGSGGNTTAAGRFPITINGGQSGGTGGGGSKGPTGFFVSAGAAAGGVAGATGANGTNGAGTGGGGGGATSSAGSTGGAQTVGGTMIPTLYDFIRGAHTPDNVSMSFGTGGGAGGNGSSVNGFGGAGGGLVFVAVPIMAGTGAIQARGGNGGTAVASDNAGGGGGGGGGMVVLIYDTGASSEAVDANGGTGGGGSTGDATGSGGNGGTGYVYKVNLSGDGT
jgi:hypothetical protein